MLSRDWSSPSYWDPAGWADTIFSAPPAQQATDNQVRAGDSFSAAAVVIARSWRARATLRARHRLEHDFLDGERQEVRIKFGAAEKRRSINWRELLGILRIVEEFGPSLRGRLILIETDNTSAHAAAQK